MNKAFRKVCRVFGHRAYRVQVGLINTVAGRNGSGSISLLAGTINVILPHPMTKFEIVFVLYTIVDIRDFAVVDVDKTFTGVV